MERGRYWLRCELWQKVVDVVIPAHVTTPAIHPRFLRLGICTSRTGVRVFSAIIRVRDVYRRDSSVPHECTLGVLARGLVSMSDIGFSSSLSRRG